MNDIHSHNESIYKSRWLKDLFQAALKEHPVVVLTGARQVGKSTFLLHNPGSKKWDYLSLDDFDLLERAQRDPLSLLEGRTHVILDEVQRAPKLLLAVKKIVDEKRGKVHFILSGSLRENGLDDGLSYDEKDHEKRLAEIFPWWRKEEELDLEALGRGLCLHPNPHET